MQIGNPAETLTTKEVVMSTNTNKVTVYRNGVLVRISSTAGEALRASFLPTAGMNHTQRLALASGVTFTTQQLTALAKKAQRNSANIAEREMLRVSLMAEATTARLASERSDVFGSVERDYEGALLAN